jgi:nucleoside triphosphate diphosphatase
MSARRPASDPSPDPTPSALDGIPHDLGALERAGRLGAQAAAVGFDWEFAVDVLPKVQEEVDELVAAIGAGDEAGITEELGDLLFTICNLARHLRVPTEQCLHQANDKFVRRFRALEAAALADGPIELRSMRDLETRWQAVKASERSG